VYQGELAEAVNALDRIRVTSLSAALVEHLASTGQPYSEDDARRHLKTLRNKRFFDHVAQLADWFLRTNPTALWIRRDLAQALLDRGQVATAMAVLESILRERELSPKVKCEAAGLLGRAHKQIYVDSKSADPLTHVSLRQSISKYWEIYASGPSEHLWHGVNVVTLLCRAERDGVDVSSVGTLPTAQELARDILRVIDERQLDGTLQIWDLATAAEARIALGDYAAAGKLLTEYAKAPGVDAFELGSCYRQLTEVAQLERRQGDERFLVDLVRHELLKRRDGGFEAAAAEVRERALHPEKVNKGLEQVFGDDSYVVHSWLLTAFKRAAAVARVKRVGRTRGTGFIVPGWILHNSWDHQVLLTNNHVLSQKPVNPNQVRPSEAEIAFDGVDAGGPLRIKGTPLFESPIDELDVTIVRLDRPVEHIEPLALATELPSMCEPPPRMYIIGHPNGSELAYSLADNRMLAISERRIHYRSPTDPGSSGSPVFDERWDLVAIHRRGDKGIASLSESGKTYDANEGVPILTIVKAIAATQQ
jgi:hypothetical protein